MSKMDPLHCFKLYIAIKNHFTRPSYDYFKYNGKTRISLETFNSRRDKWSFVRLCNQYPESDMLDLIVSNCLEQDNLYVNTLLEGESKEIFLDYRRRHQSLTYVYTNDLAALFKDIKNPNQILRTKGGTPLILSAAYGKNISIETFTILNYFLNFFEAFTDKLNDEFIWPKYRLKCEKYLPFIQFDKPKFAQILKDTINEL